MTTTEPTEGTPGTPTTNGAELAQTVVPPEQKCEACGYLLHERAANDLCPECGAPVVWRKKRSKRLIATTALAILWGTTPPLWGFVLLAYLGPISEWLSEDPVQGIAIFASIFILAAGTGMLPTYAQAILGGWAFGFWFGFGASIVGFVGGAFVGWSIARLISGEGVEAWLDSKPKARIVREALVNDGFWRTLFIVTLLRLPPNSPFALSNLAMSASGVRLAPFLIGTGLGMAPRTAIACWIAAEGATHAADLQELVRDKGWGTALIGLGAMVVCFGIIGLIGRAALKRTMASSAARRAA